MQVSSTQINDSYVVGSTQKINSFTLSNSKEFFDILSKNLYSDPVRAVIRETICNAWDSHIKAGKTNIPIKATYDGDNIVVQDFGTGIPHEDIPTVYGVFGGSTKILDDTQTGGFGLGCKAPFAIAESFTVQDIYNGIKGIYSCLRNDPDNNGLPSIRTIVKVLTDKPNGITVTIPYTEEYSENRVNDLIEDTIKLGDILALVLVQPEDIISVPESDTAKIRVCKYQILTVLDNKEGKLSNDEISFWINLPAPLPKEVVEIKGRTQDFTVTPIQQLNPEPKKKSKKEIKSGKISKEKKSSIVNNVKEIVDNLKKKDIEKLIIKLLDTGELTQDEIQQILNYKKKAKKSLNALFGISRANYFRKYIGEIE